MPRLEEMFGLPDPDYGPGHKLTEVGQCGSCRDVMPMANDAAYQHVDSMVAKADVGPPHLLWHGWALRESFLAGVEWQRKQSSQYEATPLKVSQANATKAKRTSCKNHGDK